MAQQPYKDIVPKFKVYFQLNSALIYTVKNVELQNKIKNSHIYVMDAILFIVLNKTVNIYNDFI